MNDNELTLKLDRARWFILSSSPFYGSLAMALQDKLRNPHGKTACTDGKSIHWDKDFLAKLSDTETRYVLLHETLHCAHGHLWRFPSGSVDHETANCACDHAINLTLNASGLTVAMPQGGLADNKFSGLSEEEIYVALSQQPKQPKNGQSGAGNGPGAAQNDPCGDFTVPADQSANGTPGMGQSDKPATNLRDDWRQKVIQAAQSAKASGQGTLPADLERELSKITAIQIDWRQETAQFVKNSAESRNDWTRGNRRHLWQSVVYPSRKPNEIGLIIGVRDTSGSITDKLAAEFSAILGAAGAELNCELILIDCDADIKAEYRIAPGEEIPLKACGGGGTSFGAPFARVTELMDQGEKIAGLIYLTDLYGDCWPETETVPTLCLCTNDQQAISGRTVRIMD